ARSAQDLFHPVAATQETTLLRVRSSPSAFRVAPPPSARSVPQPHKPPHRAHSPTAPSLKTSVPPPQIPGTARAASILDCAVIQIPASPSLKSRSHGIPLPQAPLAPSHKTPPF